MHRLRTLALALVLSAGCSPGTSQPLIPTSEASSLDHQPTVITDATAAPTMPASTPPVEPSTTAEAPEAGAADDDGRPVAGDPGMGDPYFPALGNGGYDVLAYHLDLDIDPTADTLAGVAVIEATALETLASFHLDLAGLTVTGALVDGIPAHVERDGSELVLVPVSAIPTGSTFEVEVAYEGSPDAGAASSPFVMPTGWVNRDGVVYVTAEPDGARTWFPANDHPADKARFSFEITVPDPAVAVANGELTETRREGDRTTYSWVMNRPMATYLATVVVGELERVEYPGPDGVVLRDYLPADLAADPPEPFGRVGEMIEFFESRFGPYPFEHYGHVVVPGFPGALETQTISIFGRTTLGSILETIVVHELAHQWFGDSVTPEAWNDIWLNEGFATYAEWLWTEHRRGRSAMLEEIDGAHSFLSAVEHSLAGDPGVADLFGQSVYVRGGLTLHALRAEVGDRLFFDILRTWTRRHRYSNAGTADFVALAEELAARDLGELFDAWLYRHELPALPALSG